MCRFLLIIFALCLAACQESYIPKPKAYFRITFSHKMYSDLCGQFPFSFEKADYTKVNKLMAPEGQIWINLTAPVNKADIHISYELLHNDLDKHIEEARRLAYDHSIKADAIDEQLYTNPTNQVYGIVYRIKGNAASPMQFFLTDSTQNFIRGAFYIREVPNIDSIQPVIDFYEADIVHLIETFQWTNK